MSQKNSKDKDSKIQAAVPLGVQRALENLENAGFEAFLVGGCVRDLILKKEPKDWDITTNAKPEEVLAIFPKGKYENQFGTVLVPRKYLRNVEELFSEKEEVKEKDSEKKNIRTESLKGKGAKDQAKNYPKNQVGALKGKNVSRETFLSDSSQEQFWIGEDEHEKNVEITTYRIESKYSDHRHPDQVRFAKTLDEDLSRRDFTCNALALRLLGPVQKEDKKRSQKNGQKEVSRGAQEQDSQNKFFLELHDPFLGQKDIEKKLIRAVGEPNERFDEDALRMMRAIRFAVELGFEIEEKTFDSVFKNADKLRFISSERIRDELVKIVLSGQPARGIDWLTQSCLIDRVVPEIRSTIGVRQNRHHYHGPYNTVYAHMLASLEKCQSPKLEVRLAALLHDIGKPATKRGQGIDATFHGHEYLGAKLTRKILERLKFPRKVIEKTVLLVKSHMFYYNVDEVGESGVRRVVRKVGLENINDLIEVRVADRLGSGVPKAVPYKLRHFQYMVDKVSTDPISVKQLKIDGNDLMKELKMKPGPKIGTVLEVLLARAIEDPQINQKEQLLKLARELLKKDLPELRKMAKQRIKEEKKKKDQKLKGRHWVK